MIQKTNTLFDIKGNVKNVKELGGELLESETKEKTYNPYFVIIIAVFVIFLVLSDSVLSMRLRGLLGMLLGLGTGFSLLRNRGKKQ